MGAAPGLSALVVDDSATMRLQLGWALRRIVGLTVVEAVDGADAWKKLGEGRYDILITDVNMPVMDGLKLISLVRGGGAHRAVPIIVITTEGASRDRDRALRLGASAYLAKPVQANEVVRAVKSLLGIR